MTGPEHYREAEALLDEYEQGELSASAIALAQVHATLALTAATAQNIERNNAKANVLAALWDEALKP
jgi:hypothetical protein